MPDVFELKKYLAAVTVEEEWLHGLPQRKRDEVTFHDTYRGEPAQKTSDQGRVYGNRKFYSITDRSRIYVEQWLGRTAPGRIVLDYACGNGHYAIMAAEAGAALAVEIDISQVAVDNAKSIAAERGVSLNTAFLQADAEATRLPDSSVDIVMCSGMLHHLDLSYAFPELRRILKPGGKVLAVEALNYNPAIKLYRRLTPEMRTEWEAAHILSLNDLNFAKRFFSVGEIRFWHITEMLAVYLPLLRPLLGRVDQVLERVPLLQLMSWTFTFELIKRIEA